MQFVCVFLSGIVDSSAVHHQVNTGIKDSVGLHPDTNNSIGSNPIQSPSVWGEHMVVVVVRDTENLKHFF